MAKKPVPSDESDLAKFGYAQSLGRSLGAFSSFAAGFAYISILTGLFQMVPLGYRAAGPAFVWTWPVVVCGQFLVALCFAELSAQIPLCGSVYQWSKHLGGNFVGWMAGWVSLAGSVAALAAVSMALQASLPVISPIFQLVGDASNPQDSAKNAVLLGTLLIVITTYLNVRAVTLLAKFNNIGVAAELTGAVLLVVLFFAVRRHSPVVLTHAASGFSLSPSGFLAAALTASYVLYGFETAGSLAEETVEPRSKSPRAILLAIGSAGVVGGLLIATALMAAPNPLDPALGQPDGGLARIATDTLGPGVSRVFLVVVAIAIASCALTVQTGAVRLVYAMARDGLLPGSGVLARVGGASKTPAAPAVIVGLIASLILLVNINHPQVVEAIGSVSVVWINLAYLFVTVPGLVSRWKSRRVGIDGGGYFHLGKVGLLVNFAAVVWGIAIVVNTGWPRPGVYGDGLPQRFLAPCGTIALLILGAFYYNWSLRRESGQRTDPGQE